MYETTTKTDRNKFIVAHLVAGKSLSEVQQLLIDANYGKIDATRVWKIWKKSEQYIARRAKEQYCSMCLENRATTTMCSVVKSFKVIGKMCGDCWDRRPKQPIKQDE
mgnify:CR=1 FL=1